MVVEKRPYGEICIRKDGTNVVRELSNSHLWVSEHSLTKSEVTELISHLQAWVETGSLEIRSLKGE